MLRLLLAYVGVASAQDKVTLVSFDGAKATSFPWKLVNDPVMGGVSNSNYSISSEEQSMLWTGEVKIVPSLKAPGFTNLETSKFFGKFNDASGFSHLVVKMKSDIPYTGFKLSFAANTINPQFKSFKADFFPSSSGEWEDVYIPLTNFSNNWSAYTGEPIVPCSSEHPEVCPTQKSMQHIQQVGLWCEGVAGKFNVEIKKIFASSVEIKRVATTSKSTLPTTKSTVNLSTGTKNKNFCAGSVQKSLKFSISSISAKDVGLPDVTDPSETLAEAICCDPHFAGYAEPNGFMNIPQISLFPRLLAERLSTHEKETTFYDSVCGVPLFVVPRNRTFSDFRKESEEHGWPSFRKEEMVEGNVHVGADNHTVFSSCGTKLGTLESLYTLRARSHLPPLPSANSKEAMRYCLDLVCVSGYAAGVGGKGDEEAVVV